MELPQLITRCEKGERKAQKLLYERYSPMLYPIALRYLKNREDAEDILIEGMYKIFSKIKTFKAKGSFEGWMRRIIVNEALGFLRKNHNYKMVAVPDYTDIQPAEKPVAESDLYYHSLIELVEQLPTGYKTVFNLYVIEGYKHREIADLLDISIHTSKSQLIQARKKLEKMVELRKKKMIRNGEMGV